MYSFTIFVLNICNIFVAIHQVFFSKQFVIKICKHKNIVKVKKVFFCSPVENVPNLGLLSVAVLRELKNHSLDFGDFVEKVAR